MAVREDRPAALISWPPVRGSRRISAALLGASGALFVVLLGGCGGTRQDAHEPKGDFQVAVVSASFPTHQAIARPTRLLLRVRNTGVHTVPNIAVSLDSLAYTDTAPELASSKRPVWIVDEGPGEIPKPPVETEQIESPGGGETAYVNTWALGTLAPGATRTFLWRVTPVKAGAHTVDYTVAAGLAGRAHAQLASGAPVSGHFSVQIAGAPPTKHVNPDTGRVVSSSIPVGP
jgi:hypothetical protein